MLGEVLRLEEAKGLLLRQRFRPDQLVHLREERRVVRAVDEELIVNLAVAMFRVLGRGRQVGIAIATGLRVEEPVGIGVVQVLLDRKSVV
jgi:hypothetical protein